MRAHRLFYIALILGLSLAPATPDDPLKGTIYTDTALEAMDTALHALNLTRDDLKFEKKNAPTTLRLKIADQTLDDPLMAPVLADQYAAKIKGASAQGLVRIAEDWLVWPGAALQMASPKQPPAPPASPSLFKTAEDLHDSEDRALGSLDKAFAGLTPKEKEDLLYAAPLFVFDEERTPLEFYEKHPAHSQIPTKDALAIAAKVQLSQILAATSLLTADVQKAVETLKMVDISKIPANLQAPNIEGNLVAYSQTPYGEIAIGGMGRNVYHCKCRIIID
ncbi:MAG: hypothetical protein ACREDG_08080, partial [Methylocella sp.]